MKRIILAFIFITASVSSFACDICGNGAGGSYLGMLPEFRRHFFGLRYQRNGLVSHLGPDGTSTYQTTHESYRTMEFWGATQIGKKFRVAVFAPYLFLSRSNSAGPVHQNGMGDVSVIGYYNLLSRNDLKNDKLLSQSLWIGAGAKLPTGRYNPEEKNVAESGQNTFQLGTGSLDLSLHVAYDIRFQNTGLNVNAACRFNRPNRYDYRYGDKLTLTALLYHRFMIAKTVSVTPNAGAVLDRSAKDRRTADIVVWETGGRSVMGAAGLELSFKRLALGASFQTPLSQSLGEGKLKAEDRAVFHLSFLL